MSAIIIPRRKGVVTMQTASGQAPTPASPSLYERVKADVYRKMPQHSAYRSGHVVKQYKAAFAKRFGSKRRPYKAKGKTRSKKRRTKGRTKGSKSKRSNRGKSKRSNRSKRGKKKRRRAGTAKGRRSRGLTRWFAEKWRNQRGRVGYKYKSDVYRPTVRITKKTPVTHGELTRREVRRARRTKARKGRVGRFRRSSSKRTKRTKRMKR